MGHLSGFDLVFMFWKGAYIGNMECGAKYTLRLAEFEWENYQTNTNNNNKIMKKININKTLQILIWKKSQTN
jgi:hypothetical protein